MKSVGWVKLLSLVAALLQLGGPASATEFTIAEPTTTDVEYSPFINRKFPQRVFWGDTHLHTTYSPDAGMVGNFKLGPADAYRFARGEQVEANNGMQVKLVRPLDFLVVSDHSEYQGLMPVLRGGDPELLKNEVGKRWYNWFKEGPEGQYKVFIEFGEDLNNNEARIPFDDIARSTWDFMAETADTYNDPGQFTAFHRLRVDLYPAGKQPSSGRDLQRRRRQGDPSRAVLLLRQCRSGRPLAVPRKL